MIICDFCPAAYHDPEYSDCLSFYPDFLQSSKLKGRWKCPHHFCHVCYLQLPTVEVIFRCEFCPAAFCENCLPREHEIVGMCLRFALLGNKMSPNVMYILCSERCINEIKSSRSKAILQEYCSTSNKLHDAGFSEYITSYSPNSLERVISEAENQNFVQNDSSAIRRADLPNLVNIHVRKHDTMPSERDLVTSIDKAVEEKTASTSQRALLMRGATLPALESLCLDRCLFRLQRSFNPLTAGAKFSSLSEIANFEKRWRELRSSDQQLLFRILCSVTPFMNLADCRIAEQVIACSNKLQADQIMTDFILHYCGLKPSTNYEELQEIYLGLLSVLKSVELRDLQTMSALFGLVQVSAISKKTISERSEPKFRFENQ